jgi:branched-chain amino acid transport system ATP-binding protein
MSTGDAAASSLLEVTDLDVYHGQLRAVADFSLTLAAGSTVGVIGANGAGKTTLLRCLAGVLPAKSGRIVLDGTDITALAAHRRVELGIASVPEGRRLFGSLSLQDNLLTGRYRKRSGPWTLDAIYELFDWMPARAGQSSRQLSGGEQQAVAIGRALLANPRVLLIDELSLGLAPVVVKRIYATLPRIVAGGTAVLLVEQDVSQAMAVVDSVHCLLEGHTVLSGRPRDLDRGAVEDAYFGLAAGMVG